MGRSINPILLDAASAMDTPRRNWARAPQTPDGASFAEHLDKAAAPTAPQAVTAPETAKETAATTTTAAAETRRNWARAPEAASAPDPEADGTDGIKPASSWRVNRSAAEVHHEVDDFSFDDFLDVINPLQHIPILGAVYREMSGDEIKPVARVAGDVLFGAVTGSLIISALASVATAAYEQQTGQEPVIQVADALFGIKKANPDAAPATMLAEADDKTAPGGGAVKLASAETAAATTPAAPMAAPLPAPVQVAALDPGINDVAAAASSATPKAKQPFGGVMDTAAFARNKPQATALASSSSVPGMRIGDTIYTSPLMNNAARLAALRAAKTAPAAKAAGDAASSSASQSAPQAAPQQSTPAPSLASLGAPAASMSVPGSTPSNDKTLGQMMHQSAVASETGRALPPELVRDMMLMALDKYKTASGHAPSEINLGATN